jgi:hypothetical protein
MTQLPHIMKNDGTDEIGQHRLAALARYQVERQARRAGAAPHIDDVPRGLDAIEAAIDDRINATVKELDAGIDPCVLHMGAIFDAVAVVRRLYASDMHALRSGLEHAEGLLNDPDGSLHAYACLRLAVQRCLGFPA